MVFRVEDIDERILGCIIDKSVLKNPDIVRLLLVAVNIVHARKGVPKPEENGLIAEVNNGLIEIIPEPLWHTIATQLGYESAK